jgi:hypothetical protein
MGSKRKRSGFEDQVAEVLEPAGFQYESASLLYYTPHQYTPDFSFGQFHVEVKGWFRPGDRLKYKTIKKSMEDRGEILVFLFQYPNKKCSKHNKITMSEWADKEDIPWFDDPEKLAWWVLGKDMS